MTTFPNYYCEIFKLLFILLWWYVGSFINEGQTDSQRPRSWGLRHYMEVGYRCGQRRRCEGGRESSEKERDMDSPGECKIYNVVLRIPQSFQYLYKRSSLFPAFFPFLFIFETTLRLFPWIERDRLELIALSKSREGFQWHSNRMLCTVVNPHYQVYHPISGFFLKSTRL